MFLDEFQDFRHSLGDSKWEVIVMEDFKFISTTSTAVKVTSLLNGCCLRQLINQPNHRCGCSLDWSIVSDDSVIIESVDVIDTGLSDHRTVFCSLSLRKPSRAKQQVKSWNLRRIDPTRFQTDVSQVASPLAECYDSELLVDLAASLRTIELLGNGKSSVLPRDIPDSELPDFFFLFFFCFFFDQNSYLFEVNLSLNLLAILAYHILCWQRALQLRASVTSFCSQT